MSALDKAVAELEAKRSKEETERKSRQEASCAFLKEFFDADIALECTGVGQLVLDVMRVVRPTGIVCLTGVSSGGRRLPVDVADLNRELVLENNVVFGTVNANRRHYELAGDALARADRDWLAGLITRRVPVERWRDALERQPTDVKPIITF